MKYTNVPIPGPLYMQFKRQGAISSRLYVSEDNGILWQEALEEVRARYQKASF